MTKEYRNKLGELHRLDGPAIESINGTKCWYINGLKHREDGPAIEWDNGDKSWFLNGIDYIEEEYNQEVIELKLKRILDL